MQIENATDYELDKIIELSIGRILRLGSRPTQPGDIEEYDKYTRLAINADQELKDRKAL